MILAIFSVFTFEAVLMMIGIKIPFDFCSTWSHNKRVEKTKTLGLYGSINGFKSAYLASRFIVRCDPWPCL